MTDDHHALEQFVAIDSGQLLRIRLLGRGPAVVMCHESPRSAAALLPLARRLADRFTCVMLDTPGFGLSDPMPLSRPEIPDFTRCVLAVADRLGLGPVPFYGTHTGAAIAAEAALQSPQSVRAAILDGYAMFSEAERDELLAAYLPPIRHSADGTHVAWLWARVRDQFTAFPWHRVADAGRLSTGPPPLDIVQAVVDDFLLADDHYRAGYSAAFRYDHLHSIRHAVVPLHVATRTDDLLFPHLQNATALPASVTVEALPAERDAWGRRIGQLLASHTDQQPATDAHTLWRSVVDGNARAHIANTSVGPVVVRYDGAVDAPPLLLLHDVPGGMANLDHLAERLARRRRVVRLDLPGVGLSKLHGEHQINLATIRTGVAEALSEIGLKDVAVVAQGASLPVALGVTATETPLIALDPWPQIADAAGHLPEVAPRWDGAHLFAAFYWARDYDLYKPWFHRVNAAPRALGGERDVPQLHQRFRSIVLGGTTGIAAARVLYASNSATDIGERGAYTRVMLYSSEPQHDALRAWAATLLHDGQIESVSRDAGALAVSIDNTLAEFEQR